MHGYDFSTLEKTWQQFWQDHKTFSTPAVDALDASKPKYYVLDMFPYPSGRGLHVGHPLGYIATDITARFKRMQGFNVLHPMGFDAFGLPAEQFAIETGTHPEVTTKKNITTMREQLKACGLSYDWDREISTTDPEYYRWTQWIFTKLFSSWFDEREQIAKPIETLVNAYENDQFRINEHGNRIDASNPSFPKASPWSQLDKKQKQDALFEDRLAYLDDVMVNWCPGLGTVLANEEVTADGRSERGNFPVLKRPLKQWMLRITKYAYRLEDDLKEVNWPQAVKQMQVNWIGKSVGANIAFALEKNPKQNIDVFTTRPDTLFGCTYLALSAEHPLIQKLVTAEQKEKVDAFIQKMASKSDVERQADTKSKEGVFTGSYAINPVFNRKVPIWIADYVLMGYGSGAIMAVPAHDQRDFDFAKKHLLKIRAVVEPTEKFLKDHEVSLMEYLEDPGDLNVAYEGDGLIAQSENNDLILTGLKVERAKEKIIGHLQKRNLGSRQVQFKLKDWLFSRQRYWGEPFPILHGEDGEIRCVDEADLPVVLPPLTNFKPESQEGADPQPSLFRADASWKTVVINGKTYQRELNTMPQWAGSCWYYLRFTDPTFKDRFSQKQAEEYWMGKSGVDLYVGGVEHAVLHLLYARFWHKVLFDLGHVSTKEPFGRLFNQGYIQAYSYQDERGMYVNAVDVETEPDGSFSYQGKKVTRQLGKMGKSLKNSISPDEVIADYGCDTFRLYEMYLGPVEQSKTWDTEAIVGVHRFLQRVWRNFVREEDGQFLVEDTPMDDKLKIIVNKTLQSVTQDMGELKFNTAIAHLIQLNNLFVSLDTLPKEAAKIFVLMLAPIAPHICEELWKRMGESQSLAYAPWPKVDASVLKDQKIEVVVQINGKKRASLRVMPTDEKEAVIQMAKEHENVARFLENIEIVKLIYVPNRLVNFVVR